MPESIGQSVAILDDDLSVREATASLLAANGFKTSSFSGASEFLNCGRLEEFGCLILDLRLPGMNGLELQRHLAAGRQPLAIVFITAHHTPETREAAMNAGAIDFLSKPFGEDAILRATRRALERTRTTPRP